MTEDEPYQSKPKRSKPSTAAIFCCVILPSLIMWAAISLAFGGDLWGCWATLAALIVGGVAGWVANDIDANG